MRYRGANLHYFDFDLLWERITQRCFVTAEEKPRVDASSKARNIPCDTSLECCSNVRENYCRMWWLGSWTMCVARWRREKGCERLLTERRERSSSPLGKYAVERSAFNSPWRYTRASYCRFLLPPRFFLLDQCRSSIITLARIKENCWTYVSQYSTIINCDDHVKDFK